MANKYRVFCPVCYRQHVGFIYWLSGGYFRVKYSCTCGYNANYTVSKEEYIIRFNQKCHTG